MVWTGYDSPAITDPQQLEQTLACFKQTFMEAGLAQAWQRVIAVVVQPGVDFGDVSAAIYDPAMASDLAAYHGQLPRGMTYEIHAADYQTPEALKQMVRDHFNLIKIGPCLTFRLREALYALSFIEEALPDPGALSHLQQTMEQLMLANPTHWRKHYRGTAEMLNFLRHFS